MCSSPQHTDLTYMAGTGPCESMKKHILLQYIKVILKSRIKESALNSTVYATCILPAVCCGVRGRALALHTGVRRFDSRGRDCLLLFADYKLRSIYKSWKAQFHFN